MVGGVSAVGQRRVGDRKPACVRGEHRPARPPAAGRRRPHPSTRYSRRRRTRPSERRVAARDSGTSRLGSRHQADGQTSARSRRPAQSEVWRGRRAAAALEAAGGILRSARPGQFDAVLLGRSRHAPAPCRRHQFVLSHQRIRRRPPSARPLRRPDLHRQSEDLISGEGGSIPDDTEPVDCRRDELFKILHIGLES